MKFAKQHIELTKYSGGESSEERPMPISKQLFKVAAGLSFAVTIFQVVVLFSPIWSRYFGAPA